MDVNTASAALLSHVAGLNKRTAESIVAYRNAQGPFATREQMRKVPGIGPATFQQAAGFLKIPGGVNPLDDTFIHPESYAATERLIALMPAEDGARLSERAGRFREALLGDAAFRDEVAVEAGVGEPTLLDILENLAKPGRDPRSDLPPPLLRRDVLTLDDLHEGMVLQGTVRNVVDFGAFVDIGLKNDGLIHRSEMGSRFVRDPLTVVSVGDIVTVRVVSIDKERGRIALSMRGTA